MKKIYIYLLILSILISIPCYSLIAETAKEQYWELIKEKNLSDLDIKIIEMDRVIPIIREFEKKIGKEKVKQILEQEVQEQILRAQKAAKPVSIEDLQKNMFPAFINSAQFQYEIVKETSDTFSFNITKCPYADLMKKLNAQDLGEVLLCQRDYITAARLGLKLTRKETIMSGGNHCGFCYTVLNKMN